VRKSDGNGLYMTKDLALAELKFGKYDINRSIYVVDAAQSHHFKQCFKTLELMNFKDASKCYHLAYGQVVLPDGKMSSRKGNVVLFTDLVTELNATIMKQFLQAKEGEWSAEEIDAALHAIAKGTIKYGMLNNDVNKDIVFELDKWCQKSGNCGPYLMYQYTRVASIKDKAALPKNVMPDVSALADDKSKGIMLDLAKFHQVVDDAATQFKPSIMCGYLYRLCKKFSSWYDVPSNNIKACKDPAVKAARLHMVDAMAQTLKQGLNLLGIDVLQRM